MKKYTNEHGENIVQITLDEIGPVTEEDREMMRKARLKEPFFDEDCPPMSEALHRQAQSLIAQKRRLSLTKETVV